MEQQLSVTESVEQQIMGSFNMVDMDEIDTMIGAPERKAFQWRRAFNQMSTHAKNLEQQLAMAHARIAAMQETPSVEPSVPNGDEPVRSVAALMEDLVEEAGQPDTQYATSGP